MATGGPRTWPLPLGPLGRALGARPKGPEGRGQALGPPVAMYFHKKGIETKYKIYTSANHL